MTATTPRYAIPYPQGTDRVMDGDNAMQAIAERVEAVLGPVDDLASVAPSGFRNVIRNGDMGIAQRGNGPYGTGGLTGLDGWAAYSQGTGTFAATRLALGAGAGVGALGAAYAFHGVTAGFTGATDQAQITARIEGVRTLAGRTVTLSFQAVAASGTPKIGVEVSQRFGSGGSPSATVTLTAQAVTIAATAARYSLTFAMPSIAGKTIGTNGDDCVQVTIFMSAGASVAGGLVGNQANTFDITDVQLEAGASATPFERLPAQQQLAWCQRYFVRMTAPASGHSFAVGQVLIGTQANIVLPFPVVLRSSPTFNATLGGLILYDATGTPAVTGWAAATYFNAERASLNPTCAGGLSVGRAVALYNNSAALSTLDFSAEL